MKNLFFLFFGIGVLLSHPSILIFAENKDIYTILEGIWQSPAEGELTAYFNFNNKGNFTISVVPDFEYDKLTAEQQEEVIKQNTADIQGYIKIIKPLSHLPHQQGLGAEAEIYLNGEKSTNNIDVTETKIYTYTSNESDKVIFAEKPSSK
ncbi:MAG: hypothetical protein ACRCTJ_06005 [Brevinema sp.]